MTGDVENSPTDFRVRVKPSALAASPGARELVDEWGRTVTFPDRGRAERVAADLAARGPGDLWIQSAAAADGGVDAYLVGRERVPGEPVEREDGSYDCRVSATQYGRLGEALVVGPPPCPALRAYVLDDLPLPEDGRERASVTVDPTPPPVFVPPDPDGPAPGGPEPTEHATTRWVPDCRLVARLPGEDRPVARYYCEVKTGDGSPERSQRRAMRAAARDAAVLLVSVDVADLPEAYAVSVAPVGDDRP